jgi:rod shape-determining protein MreC
MLKRPHLKALALIVLLTMVILNLPTQLRARVKLGIGSLFLPLFGLVGFSHQLLGQTGDALTPRSDLLRQNERLRRENEELRAQTKELEELRRENDRLRKSIGWQQRQPWTLKAANVVLHDPANWWHTIQIDLGQRDGIITNLPVLNVDGFLVGRVSSVSLTRSQVVLLGDPNCKVAVRVENETGDMGIIGAAGPLDSEFVDISYLSRNANVKPGQNVKTSGEGGIFPKDIPIGKVVDTRTAEYGLSTSARVKLGANLNGLEQVWVRVK